MKTALDDCLMRCSTWNNYCVYKYLHLALTDRTNTNMLHLYCLQLHSSRLKRVKSWYLLWCSSKSLCLWNIPSHWKGLPLGPVLSHLNPVHTFTHCFSETNFNTWRSKVNNVCIFYSTTCVICPTTYSIHMCIQIYIHTCTLQGNITIGYFHIHSGFLLHPQIWFITKFLNFLRESVKWSSFTWKYFNNKRLTYFRPTQQYTIHNNQLHI